MSHDTRIKLRQSGKEQFVLRAAATVLITAAGKRTQLGLTFESEGEMSGKLRKAGKNENEEVEVESVGESDKTV